MSHPDSDYLYRFLFEQFGVRGEFVRLGASWQAVLQRHDYPEPVRPPLGNALAAVLLLSGTIKFQGSLGLQLQGDGLISAILAQATEDRTLRGMARFDPALLNGAPEAPDRLLGSSRLVLTAQALNGERYQGIVPVEGGNVAGAVEGYFAQSEQLPTRLWLAADGEVAAGLFLQRLPQTEQDDDDWHRVCMLADTLKEDELLHLPVRDLLRRLFHEDSLRLFDPDPVAFRCGCSRERIGAALVSLGEGEIGQMLEEMGSIEVDCEFCNAHYRFDAVDAAALFSDATLDAPDALQ